MDSLQINYSDGSSQVINPSQWFDGNYHLLAYSIAKNSEFEYKVLREGKPKRRKR